MGRRVDIQAILRNPTQRRSLMVQALIATQAREGIETSQEQAEAAYDRVQKERSHASLDERTPRHEGQTEDR